MSLACGDSAGLGSLWTGSSSSGISFNITMSETPQGAVTGAGVVATGVSTLPVNIAGAHAHPSLSLTFTFPGSNFAPVSFQGVFNSTFSTVTGLLNGSGFVRDTLRLNRNLPAVTSLTAP